VLRSMLSMAVTCALLAAAAPAATQTSADESAFSAEVADRMASERAKAPFQPPQANLPAAWANLGYDQYRDVRFRMERAIWHGEQRNFEVHLLPSGWLFKNPVDIHIVQDGRSRKLQPDTSLFEFGNLAGAPPPHKAMPFSGFRINGPINRPNLLDEIVVFQGASYFRAVSRGQVYGLSGRGLAIDTGEAKGEEFPAFRSFWIERPPRGAREVVVHALLDSPSTAGAYTFRIAGGAPTTMDVDVRLFPRRDGMRVGVAPLTSMFLFSDIDRARINDFRRAVHDSDGLAIVNAGAEHIWRPLTNPKRLQVSEFLVDGVTGFGLIQRSRNFASYGDLEANYERRPSAWIQPLGWWGKGSVHLVEIPSEEEIHDNIVAYWRPQDPYRKDEIYRFGYRIVWSNDKPVRTDKALVINTSSGLAAGAEQKEGAVRYAVDFGGPALGKNSELPTARLTWSAGTALPPVVQRNPHTGGVRVSFLLRPEGADLVEMRLELRREDQPISEVWLSRWTK
jgi:periplasmic glucans biosynthesis protein